MLNLSPSGDSSLVILYSFVYPSKHNNYLENYPFSPSTVNTVGLTALAVITKIQLKTDEKSMPCRYTVVKINNNFTSFGVQNEAN